MAACAVIEASCILRNSKAIGLARGLLRGAAMRIQTQSLLSASLAFSIFGCTGHMESTGGPTGNSTPGGGDSGDDVGGGTTSGSDETFDEIDCPDGQDPLFKLSPDLLQGGLENLSSGIQTGSGGTPMTLSCGVTGCAAGQVGVEVEDNPLLNRDGIDPTIDPTNWEATVTIKCVEAPPSCGAGTSPFFVNSVPDPENGLGEIGGFWSCSEPCEVIVDFGGIYGFQSACAEAPPSCGGTGEAATFTFESQEWECSPMCDGGLYDPVDFQGTTVCVPC